MSTEKPRLKRTHALLRSFAFLACLTYAVALLAFLVLRGAIGDSTWWMSFLNTFALWMFAPLAVLLPLAIVVGARRGTLLLLPFAAFALLIYAPYFLPRAHAALPEETTALRVVTFNVWGGNSAHAESTGFAAIGDWLRTLDADIILLQEVPLSQRTRPDGIFGLGDLYPQQIYAETDQWTRAMLSRLPVIESTNNAGDITVAHFQRMVVELGGRQIAIYNVHNGIPFRETPRIALPMTSYFINFALRYDPTWRDTQLRALLDALATEPLPFIVGGDFNMSDGSMIYQQLAARMTDSFRSAGWGFGTSWRADVESRGLPPLLRIDYIWHSDDFVSVQSEQGPFLGSDHLPLLSDISLP